jgi:hypothetical protein
LTGDKSDFTPPAAPKVSVLRDIPLFAAGQFINEKNLIVWSAKRTFNLFTNIIYCGGAVSLAVSANFLLSSNDP